MIDISEALIDESLIPWSQGPINHWLCVCGTALGIGRVAIEFQALKGLGGAQRPTTVRFNMKQKMGEVRCDRCTTQHHEKIWLYHLS